MPTPLLTEKRSQAMPAPADASAWPLRSVDEWVAALSPASATGIDDLLSALQGLASPEEIQSGLHFAIALAAVGQREVMPHAFASLEAHTAGIPELRIELEIARARAFLVSQEPNADTIAAAQAALDEGLRIASRTPSPGTLPRLHGYRAVAARLGGHYREALAAFRTAFEADVEALAAVDQAILWNNYGLTQMEMGLSEAAAESLQRALAIFKPLGQTRYLASVAQNIGFIYMEIDRFAEARTYMERALGWWEAVPGRELDRFLTLTNLGTLCTDLGDWPAAARSLDRAEALLPELNNPLAETYLRTNQGELAKAQGQIETARAHYAASLAIATEHGLAGREWRSAMRLGALLTAQGEPEQGWELLQRARRVFLAEQQSLTGEQAYRSILSQLNQQRDLYGALIASALEVGRPEEAWAASQEAKQAGWTAGLALPSPSQTVSPRTTAGEGRIDFFLGKDACARFLVHPVSGLHAELLPIDRPALQRALRTWQEQLIAFEQTPLGAQTHLAEHARLDMLADLSIMLLTGVEDALGDCATWLLSPHADLLAVPWSALPMKGHEPLIERHAVQLVPYFAHLDHAAAERPATGTVLFTEGATTGLAHTARERLLLERVFGAGRVHLASDIAAIQHELHTASVWHFAGHGRFDAADPLASVLETAHGAMSLAQFHAGQFAGPNLQLVVLAACETARLAAQPGHLVEGFLRALLATGTRSILAGAWKVRDDATAAFMETLYPSLAAGQSLAEAAAGAARALRASAPANHPYYWAGLQAWGDPHPLLPTAAPSESSV